MPGIRRGSSSACSAALAVAWPLAAWAAVIACASEFSASPAGTRYGIPAAFRDGLRRLGYVEGRSVEIDHRFSNGNTDALLSSAQELLQMKPDVVLASAVSPTESNPHSASDGVAVAAFSDNSCRNLPKLCSSRR